jgi:hypothetical protein
MFTQEELSAKFKSLVEETDFDKAVIKLMSVAKKDNPDVTMSEIYQATDHWHEDSDERLKLQNAFRVKYVNPLRVFIAKKKFGLTHQQAEDIFRREASDDQKKMAEEVKSLLPKPSRKTTAAERTALVLAEYEWE